MPGGAATGKEVPSGRGTHTATIDDSSLIELEGIETSHQDAECSRRYGALSHPYKTAGAISLFLPIGRLLLFEGDFVGRSESSLVHEDVPYEPLALQLLDASLWFDPCGRELFQWIKRRLIRWYSPEQFAGPYSGS